MPKRVRKLDTGSEEPPRKKRPLSIDAVEPASCSCPLPPCSSEIASVANFRIASKYQFIANWLSSQSPLSPSGKRKRSEEQSNEQPNEQLNERPRKRLGVTPPPDPFPSPCDTATTASGRSVKITASVHDPDYRGSLKLRHTYIEKDEPPSKAIFRTKEIIQRLRNSPELDDHATENIRKIIRKFQDKGEEDVKNHYLMALSINSLA